MKQPARRIFLLCLCIITALLTPLQRAPAQDLPLAARTADFQTFVQDFTDNYAYLDQPNKPWLTWKVRYADAVKNAQTKGAFCAVLADALSELHDFHAEVRAHVPNHWLSAPTFADVWPEWRGTQAMIIAVRPGSDAARAGVHVGDRIVAVNSVPTAQAINARLTPAVNNADPKARQWGLLSVLAGRSEESRSWTLANAAGQQRTVTLPLEHGFGRPPGLLSATTLPGNYGCIRFQNSLGEQGTVAAFDTALAKLRMTRGLIIDLRDVPSGGNSGVALGIMGRFVETLLPYQHHRIPNYGQADVARNWIELVAPRGPFRYAAPVVVLVSHWTGSMGEGIAVGFDAMHRAIVVGTPMAHLAGGVSDFMLPKTGVDVAFPTEQIFHVNGTPRQDWLPPVLVTASPVNGSDPILARGLTLLKAKASDSPPK